MTRIAFALPFAVALGIAGGVVLAQERPVAEPCVVAERPGATPEAAGLSFAGELPGDTVSAPFALAAGTAVFSMATTGADTFAHFNLHPAPGAKGDVIPIGTVVDGEQATAAYTIPAPGDYLLGVSGTGLGESAGTWSVVIEQ